MGDYDSATQDHDQALRFSPTFEGGFNDRGLEYARTGDYDRAIKDYNQAVHLNPRLAIAFHSV